MAASWTCARCGTDRNRDRRAACCRACVAWMDARGLMWCGMCGTPAPRVDPKSRSRCRACRSLSEHGRRRGRALPPRPQAARPAATGIAAQIARAWAQLAADDWPGSLDGEQA